MSDEPRSVSNVADPMPRTDHDVGPVERTADPIVVEAPEGADAGPGETTEKRGFPSPLTIITLVLVAVWLVALFIPSGEYQLDESGRPIPGTYEEIDRPLDFGESVEDLWLSPINGLYGIEDLETGQVSPFNAGVMFGSAHVFLFILAIGGFMTVVFRTGSLDLGIAHLAHRFRARGALLIVVLSLLFGVLGSVMSWSDETLGFYALMIPLMLSLGYDRVATVGVVTVAPFVGSIGSTVNRSASGSAPTPPASTSPTGSGCAWCCSCS